MMGTMADGVDAVIDADRRARAAADTIVRSSHS